ncbi:MAG: ArsA family ATPase, partial [Solirubrobacterales bacterium]
MSAPRTILYTGKGGVGKTSVAAATARRCAAGGLRTVVLSTDPAHSLSDSLETDLGPDPTPVADRMWGQEVQAEREMEANWGAVQRWLGELLTDLGEMDIAAEELTVPPGMDELFSLLQIKEHHESGEFDVVIVDCAPTGETLRLLSFPDIARWWLEKVFPWERRVVAAARPFARSLLDVELPSEDVFGEVQRLVRNLIAMNEILRDRERASIRLVMNPDRMVIKEAQRTFTYLNLYGYLTDAVVVNRIFPDEL